MSRSLLFSLFLIGLFLFAGNAWSQEESDFNIIHKGEKQILVDYTGDAETVEIPEGVTSIGDNAFSGCDSVTSIVIPKGVTKIGDNAFSDCTSLTSIVFPKGVKKIGDDLFEGCQNLTIHAPRGSKIEEYAKENEIPFKVSSKKAKSSKHPREEVVPVVVDEPQVAEVPSAEEPPTEEAVPAEEAVKDEQQENVTNFNPADYPDFKIVQEEGKTILEKYTGSDKNVLIPKGVTEIGYDTFSYCSSLTSIKIPEGVTKIGICAFYGCISLTSVVIPEGVKEIGDCAFRSCNSLTSVEIPEDVTEIGRMAFTDCPKLTIQAPKGSKAEEYAEENGIPFKVKEDEKIKSGALANEDSVASVSKLQPTSRESFEWYGYKIKKFIGKETDVVIPDDTEGIGEGAFSGCDSLKSVIIPEGVKVIERAAFYGCKSLTSVTIPVSVEKIGVGALPNWPKGGAFLNCPELKQWTISPDHPFFKSDGPALLTKDGKKLIACPGAEGEYQIPEGVTEIGNDAFCGCKALTSLVIPDSLTEIGEEAFWDCISLKAVVIPEGVTKIGNNAFWYCNSLESVSIPEGVTEIGKFVFDGCSSLKSIVIPKGVTTIGNCAFRSCNSLTSVEIPEDVTEIGGMAFADCPNLTIQAPKGAKAEEYAKKNGIPFKVSSKESSSKKQKETQVEGSPVTEASTLQESDIQNIVVPDDYPTIKEAYANVKDGGIITIKPGKYELATTLEVWRNVTFRSDTGDPKSVVIDCTSSSTFLIAGSPSFQNLTVSNGSENGCCFLCCGTPKLFGCIITSRKGIGMGIGGKNANPEIEKCFIKDNVTGVIVENEGRGKFINCEISGNVKAGIQVGSSGTPTVTRCDIFRNLVAGIGVVDSGTPTVTECKIHDGEGVGVAILGGLGTFNDCEIYGNVKAGVNVGQAGNPTFTGCNIHDGKGPGVLVIEGGKGTFNNNTLKENNISDWFILAAPGDVRGSGNTPEIPY